jgi:hypothetical protein
MVSLNVLHQYDGISSLLITRTSLQPALRSCDNSLVQLNTVHVGSSPLHCLIILATDTVLNILVMLTGKYTIICFPSVRCSLCV